MEHLDKKIRKLRDKADKARQTGQTKKALDLYLDLCNRDPDEPRWPHQAGEMRRKLGQLEEASSFGPWLRTIARNRGRTWLERSRRQPVQEELAVERIAHDGDSPEKAAERSERRRMVLSALERLPETSREPKPMFSRNSDSMASIDTSPVLAQLSSSEEALGRASATARHNRNAPVFPSTSDSSPSRTCMRRSIRFSAYPLPPP